MAASASLLARLGITWPLIQAPMAGVSTPALAAAVSEAGALGSLGLGACTAAQAAELIAQTRERTSRPFNVNLFCHRPAHRDAARERAWLEFLAPEFRRFGAQPPTALQEGYATLVGNVELLQMLLALRPAVVSFHFGLPEQSAIDALREVGIVTMACATNVQEAAQIVRSGIDILIAQGAEAGGHRGCFDPAQDPMLGTFALVRMLAARLPVPVIAAGGIMDGAGMAAALRLGAAAVQLGTAFILCPESSASAAYRAALQSDQALQTAVTSAISGRPARGIAGRLHALGARADAPALPDYPVAYSAAKALHQVAVQHGCHDYAAHWAGQAAPLARALPAAQLVATLVQQWQAQGVTATAGS
ncbi:2-nitropropane dioxygenase [Lampropedia cohaerens]|uniref:Nitronate monooxygenase n=1 Tax=Lampropedia cohaerens TaxID=1610491 RepID=A0A0U1PXD9_9BURK|nr:nitronate monooxygenase [Lampropedia cohaerens]KKW67202.1 2-nitropropane dioxygenase [Lampropedia cohaerens]